MVTKNKITWITDPHLNFLPAGQENLYLHGLAQQLRPGDSIVLTGDIAEGPSVERYMMKWKEIIQARQGHLYFVLGNHDFYYSSIATVREHMADSLGDCWLPAVGIADLDGGHTCLVGHDGWYDGLYADWMKSTVWLNDYECIKEFLPRLKAEKLNLCRDLAREAAGHVAKQVDLAVTKGFKKIFVATHVPPFRENSVYKGKISDDNWLPHFSSKIMGDTLLQLAKTYPNVYFVVLCGHSHGQAEYYPTENMESHTGFAEYRIRNIANTFEL